MKHFEFHPGSFIAEELEELGISAAEAARAMNIPPNRLSQIVNEKRSITADTALRLAKWLGTSPELWLNLQMAYDLARAEREKGEEIAAIKTRAALRS